MDKTGFAAIDIETTGLAPESCGITEIAAVRIRPDGTRKEFRTFVDPGVPVPAEITELTGITDDMLKGAPDAQTAVCDLFDFIGDVPLVFHNPRFDVAFLTPVARMAGREWRCPAIYDTRMLSMGCYDLDGYSLTKVTEALGLEKGGHHRALDDAGYTAEVFQNLIQYGKDMDVDVLRNTSERLTKSTLRTMHGMKGTVQYTDSKEGLARAMVNKDFNDLRKFSTARPDFCSQEKGKLAAFNLVLSRFVPDVLVSEQFYREAIRDLRATGREEDFRETLATLYKGCKRSMNTLRDVIAHDFLNQALAYMGCMGFPKDFVVSEEGRVWGLKDFDIGFKPHRLLDALETEGQEVALSYTPGEPFIGVDGDRYLMPLDKVGEFMRAMPGRADALKEWLRTSGYGVAFSEKQAYSVYCGNGDAIPVSAAHPVVSEPAGKVLDVSEQAGIAIVLKDGAVAPQIVGLGRLSGVPEIGDDISEYAEPVRGRGGILD